MPRSISGEEMDNSISKALQELREQWHSMSQHAQQPLDAEIFAMKEEILLQKEAEIETLEKQLGMTCAGRGAKVSDEFKFVVDEQGKLLELTLNPQFLSANKDLHDAEMSMYASRVASEHLGMI